MTKRERRYHKRPGKGLWFQLQTSARIRYEKEVFRIGLIQKALEQFYGQKK